MRKGYLCLGLILAMLCGCSNAGEKETTKVPETTEEITTEAPETTEEETTEEETTEEQTTKEPETTEAPEISLGEPLLESNEYGYMVYLDAERGILTVQYGEREGQVRVNGDRMVAHYLEWPDDPMGHNQAFYIVLEDVETGDQEAIYFENTEMYGVASEVFNKKRVLKGEGSRASFTLEDIQLQTDSMRNQVVINYCSQPYYIPCQSGMEQWILENGTVSFFTKMDSTGQNLLWCDYAFPKVDGKEVGSFQIQKLDRAGVPEHSFVWSPESPVRKGHRYLEEYPVRGVMFGGTYHKEVPAENMEEFYSLSSASEADLANAWNRIGQGVPSNPAEYCLMKVGEKGGLRIYTVCTNEKANLALFVWGNASIIGPVPNGYDARYDVKIFGEGHCMFTNYAEIGGLRHPVIDVHPREDGTVSFVTWKYQSVTPVWEKTAPGVVADLLACATLSEDQNWDAKYKEEGAMYWLAKDDSAGLIIGTNNNIFPDIYLTYGGQGWKMEGSPNISELNSIYSNYLYSIGEGEWLLFRNKGGWDGPYGEIDDEYDYIYATHLKAQPDGTLTAETWQ